ncbi:aspartate aminotransferase [Pullulanibacillus pueri]|uniref:Aminotransferase n=1 Tax=Pullulanibacillus pueri TaxID=1437324 RepID=A0A8J3ELF9_9BACL|nr:pyridoxal phosphate-dependent aminotransferase [Pullulanibacillus pueri]MBM7681434.1 aspartate aminotransferase [Pullulanibacillus pueri]GGH78862.1 aminotransferase [Pullulanibacillus pueri]
MELSQRVKNITPSSTLAITAKANELRASGIDVIGLAAGEPDFNTPEPIIEAAIKAAREGHTKYTATSGLSALKEAIVKKIAHDNKIHIKSENIIVTTGAKHALYLTFQALLNPGDEVIIPAPYWVSYTEQVKLAEGVPVIVNGLEENDFKLSLEQIKQATTEKTRAIIINSPSNPTGMIYSKEELKEIGEYCLEKGLAVISDEIYEKLVYDGAVATSIVEVVPELQKTAVMINGVSKSHAMTGWRIGYAVADSVLIKAMTNVASHSTSNPTSIAQYAALEAYTGSQESVEHMRQAFEGRLNRAYERLISIPGIRCIKPQGAFYLFPNVKRAAEMTGFSSVADWATALVEEAKIAVVPGEGFGAPDYMRLSYATSMENINEALDRLHTFMESHIK